MAIRRFGPTRGAGVVIIETEGQKQIEPSALGWVGYAGMFEKGEPGRLYICSGPKDFEKKLGARIADSEAAHCAFDYFQVANGAGGILAVCVTDGTEEEAERTLLSRRLDDEGYIPMGTVKAKSGGRWAGKEATYTGEITGAPDLTDTTVATGILTWAEDRWKGGWLETEEAPNKRYPIISSSAAGVITVAGDQTVLTDWTAGGATELRYYLYHERDTEAEVFVLIGDGEDNPTTEFSMEVYEDGALVRKYPNLNTDPTSGNYWVELINQDSANEWIEVSGSWTGAHVPDVRPADYYRSIAVVTDQTIDLDITTFRITAPISLGDPTFALGALTGKEEEQTITITMVDPTTGNAVSDKYGALGLVTLGVAFAPNNKWTPAFTVTAGGTPLVAADVLRIEFKPLVADALVGGYVYPRKQADRTLNYRIVANDQDSVTVQNGIDLSAVVAGTDECMLVAPLWLTDGEDGYAGVNDAAYQAQAWDVDDSPFNQIAEKNLGLIKFATPNVTSTAVTKAGGAYAYAKNGQYRLEFPSATLTEPAALTHVNDTIGRNDAMVGAFPSAAYVPDPEGGAVNILRSLTGLIHGREAAMARAYDGYHKAAAGLEATLPPVVKLPAVPEIINEELLNPAGIQVIIKKRGNWVIWGDRTMALDTNWRWKHQREQMSHYERALEENFDWIIFAINDSENDRMALTAIRAYFKPEYAKRAIRGKTFDDAAIIKVDAENNTDATRAAGDQFADISLRLADTVERFIIRTSKQGIFESVA